MATNNAINLKDSGIASYDGAGTFAGRTIQQPAAGITVANGNGVSGDPTLALADDLAAVEGLSGSGVVTRTGASAWSTNTIADRSIVVGDAGNTVQGIGPLSDGQLLVGATGGDPNTLTAWMQQGNNCWTWNLSFTHSAGTLTLAGADGTALSSSNPGYVVMPSNATQGRMVLHTITANDTLTVSDLTGNLFGTTTAIAWGSSLPLYIGFMADSSDANLEPIVARLPHISVSPASSANIGDPSSATADLYSSVFAWNDITEANYQSMQVGLIGSLTATKDSSDVYTLDALTDNDGVGRWNDSTLFAYPMGQNGSASGTWFHDGTGTEPIFNGAYNYTVSRNGYIYAYAQLQVCTTGGTGTASAYLTLPIRRNAGINNNQHNVMMYNAGTAAFESANAQLLGADSHWVGLYNSVISGSILTLDNIDTNDQLYVDMYYLATKTQ